MDFTKPKEDRLLALMERTGLPVIQENGQRLYGPSADWEGEPPAKGCEVFVGKIPRDLYEDELVPVFETIGPIYQVRLMMDFSNSNRGFAFVMYTNVEDAKKAVQVLDNFEIRKGKVIGVCKSVDNCRLFVGGIPKTKGREEILQEMQKITEGVVDVILYPSVVDKTKNRGFAFVEYENHRAAAMARRKLIPGKIQLWGHEIAVDWAEPEPEVDEETMNKVTILYVRNLMLSTTEEQIRDHFAINGSLKIEKVKKLRDFAFVHYRNREDAEEALETLNKSELDGAILEVTWAKPADRVKKAGRHLQLTSVPVTPVMYMTSGYEIPPLANYATNSNSLSPGGMMLPRVAVRGRGRGAAGLRSNRGGLQNYRTPLYRKSYEILQEVCQKNNWGEPVFQLLSTVQALNGENVQMFNFKVTLPGLAPNYNTFNPPKLSHFMEEAKQYAAEYALNQLGITLDNVDLGFNGYQMAVAANTPTTSASGNSSGGNFNRIGFIGGPTAAYTEYYDMPAPMY